MSRFPLDLLDARPLSAWAGQGRPGATARAMLSCLGRLKIAASYTSAVDGPLVDTIQLRLWPLAPQGPLDALADDLTHCLGAPVMLIPEAEAGVVRAHVVHNTRLQSGHDRRWNG